MNTVFSNKIDPMKNLLLACMVLLFFTACKKDEGEGGKAEINGKLVGRYFCDNTGELLETSAAIGQRVYITYGESTVFDDDVRTSGTGEFSFKFLQPGDYTITALSECVGCPSGTEVVKKSVTIGKKDRDVTAGTLTVDDYSSRACPSNPYRGEATAKGLLRAIYIDRNNGDTVKIEPLPNERVYIALSTEKTHFEDVRSSADGTFRFTRLPIGDFQVYAYSECLICLSEVEAKFLPFSITTATEVAAVGTLTVVVYTSR
jgi:hypothetical protein